MGLLSRLDEIAGQPAAAAAVPEAAPSSFSQGMRQGLTAAGGQIHALAGGVGAALGADDFAAQQYAQSKAAQELAATQAPAVNDWRQVTNAPDIMTGMRNAGSYVAGLAGQAAPALGAGLAGAGVAALSRGTINPLLAGTLAVAPMEVGGALERQQADPAAMQRSAGERLGVAALEGTARAGLMNVVPQMMGGKLLGKGLGTGAGGVIAEGVGGNALAGAAAEKASTMAEGYLNPNRDTSGDNARMVDAAVAGGALGVPFAGAGLVGHALHGKAPEAGVPQTEVARADGKAPAAPAAAEAPAPGLVDKIKSVFAKDDGADAAQKIAEGKDVIDVEKMKGAAPEQQVEMLRAADAERATTTQGWFDEMLQKTGLTDEQRSTLMSAASDFGDRANQAAVAGVKLAQDGAAKATQMAEDFYRAATSKRQKDKNTTPMVEDGKTIEGETRFVNEPQKSEVSAGTRKAIADVVTPHIAARFPQLAESSTGMASITNGLHAMMQKMQDTGRVSADAAGHLQRLFGRDLTRVLTDLHDEVLGSGHPDKVDNYFRAVNQLDTNVSSRGKLMDMMRGALPEDVRASNDQLSKMVDHLHEYVSGATLEGKTPEQAKAHARVIESALKDHFGDKADDILEAARVDHEMGREKDAQDLDTGRADGTLDDDHVERAGNSDDGFADHESAGVTTERDLDRDYYGGGRDLNKPQFMLKEQMHRQMYGNDDSPAAKILRRVSADHPDKNVEYITAAEYAKQHGAAAEDLKAMGVKGDPHDYVMVKAEGQKREGMTPRDVDRLRLDTHKYPESPSRINTESGIHKFDAVQVANHYAQHKDLPYNDADMANPMHRLRRRFVEAMGALSDHINEHIPMQDEHTSPEMAAWMEREQVGVHDNTVVSKVKRNGKPITWGEVRREGAPKPEVEDMNGASLYSAREAAVKAGDHKTVASIDDTLSSRAEIANDKYDELLDGQPKTKLSSSQIRAELARNLGDAHEAVLRAQQDAGGARGDTVTSLRKQALAIEDMVVRMTKDHYIEAKVSGQSDMFHPQERAMWVARAEHMREMADTLASIGGARKLTPRERKAIGEYFSREREYDKNEWSQAEKARRAAKGNIDDPRGPMEGDPFGEIHQTTDLIDKGRDTGETGEAFAGARNMEAGPEGNLLHADNFFTPPRPSKPGEPVAMFDQRLPQKIKGAIDSRVNSLEVGKSAVQRALGAKARDLVGKIDQLKVRDAAELASIVKDQDLTSVAKTINALHAKYKDLLPEPAPKSPFVERVLNGKPDDFNSVAKALKSSSDAKGLQRAVDAMLPHKGNMRADRVLEVANERLGKLVEANPDVAYSMQRVDPQASSTSKIQGDVRAHIEKVLGKTVDVEFAKMLHAGEFLTDPSRVPQGLSADVIRISTHSLDPMSVGYHESLHAFMAKLSDAGLMDGAHPLEKAAASPRVLGELKTLLAGEPDALAQLTSSSERVAYMYQFWAAGKLHLAEKPAGLMGKIADFFKKTLGIWTNDERAEHIMQYFHSGEYSANMRDRSAVARALGEGTNGAVEKFKAMVAPLAKLADAVASTGDARLRGTGIDALAKLADKVYAPLHGEHGGDPGYIPASRAKRGEFMNRLATELGQHDAGTVTDALESLQRGMDGSSPKERVAVAAIRKVLGDVRQYMVDKKVDIGDLGPKYFPRVWDTQTILRNEAGFRDMLQHYVTSGEFKGSVDQVIAALTRSDGSDLQVPTIKPGMQAAKERVLHFISDKDAAPFLNKNLYETVNSYITQATRRAEWSERFGDDNGKLHELLGKAQQQGATKEHLQTTSDYLQGVDGTLGDKIDPKLRRAFGNMIVYQNLRLLPLALFSSMIDPMGILVRGGTVKDTFSAMKRGFAEIPKGFKENAKHDGWTELAATMGVIDHAVLQHNLGTSFSQGMTSSWGRKLNDTFFKYNLMEQYNASMRVAATQAAVGFLARHADGTASAHSPRWLAELGFKPGDIKVANGRPLLHAHEFEAAGMAPDAAAKAGDRMTLAINKWVDGAILRPNAAHKPVWMNDPHYAVVAHLKQFVYSFQETILKRVANEVKFGNVGPAYALAAYVPFMLAADTVKGMIQGGGNQPDWKKGWDASDYAFYEVQRAGLFGVGQFGVDAAKDLHRGGLGIGALTGPTLEQMGEAVKTVAGPEQFKTFALNALPANALFDAAGAASASTNAVD